MTGSAAAIDIARAPPLTRGFKTVFGLGSMAEAIVYSTTAQFTLLYYNQVLGLNAAAVGAVMATGLIVNAVFEPVIGSWSDRTRSRLGRRHPFMLAAILPIALSFYAMFSPPQSLSDTGKLVWLGVANLVLAQAVTAFHTPHLAFGGELSPSYTERTKILGYNTFFLWVGDTACWLLAFGVFFRATAAFPNGALDPARWPSFTASTTGAIFVCLLVSSVFTLSRVRWLPQPAADTPGASLTEMARDVMRALRNRNFSRLFTAYVLLSITSGIRAGLWIYTATFIWLLTNDQITWFVVGSFISYAGAAAIVPRLHARFGKRAIGALAILGFAIGPGIALMLYYLGILTPATPGLLAILVAFGVLQHLPFSIFVTTVYSTISDIADENELVHGIRQEGILYSTSTLCIKVDQAVGAALAGVVLSVIAFPAKATPGLVDPAVLSDLALAYVLISLPGIIAAWLYGRIAIDAASHAATRAALDARALSVSGTAA